MKATCYRIQFNRVQNNIRDGWKRWEELRFECLRVKRITSIPPFTPPNSREMMEEKLVHSLYLSTLMIKDPKFILTPTPTPNKQSMI